MVALHVITEDHRLFDTTMHMRVCCSKYFTYASECRPQMLTRARNCESTEDLPHSS